MNRQTFMLALSIFALGALASVSLTLAWSAVKNVYVVPPLLMWMGAGWMRVFGSSKAPENVAGIVKGLLMVLVWPLVPKTLR